MALGEVTVKDEDGTVADYSHYGVWHFRGGKTDELKAFVIKNVAGDQSKLSNLQASHFCIANRLAHFTFDLSRSTSPRLPWHAVLALISPPKGSVVELFFELQPHSATATDFIRSLQRLHDEVKRPLTVIWDGPWGLPQSGPRA